jgi:hypothetical protein
MTIAFGVACEDGVILATDSLTQWYRNGAFERCELGSRKVGRLGERAAYIISGAPPAGYEPALEWASLPLQEAAIAMYGELSVCASKAPAVIEDGRTLPTELLVGGFDASADAMPSLMLIRQEVGLGRARFELAMGGGALVGGAMGDWARSEGVTYSPPATLVEAVPYAIAACRDHLRRFWHAHGFERLEDFTGINGEPGGYIPPSAPPFHVVTVTASGIQTLEVAE